MSDKPDLDFYTLSVFEQACLRLMVATVAANDHSNPKWVTDEIAEDHARAAVKLARALFQELENEKGR